LYVRDCKLNLLLAISGDPINPDRWFEIWEAIGFFIFGKYKPFLRTNSDDERGGDTTGIGRGSTPCCGYDDGGASSDSTSQSDFDYIPVNGENDDIHTNHISSSLFVCKTYNSTMNENSNFNLEPVSTND
jgi:hypothetical protein